MSKIWPYLVIALLIGVLIFSVKSCKDEQKLAESYKASYGLKSRELLTVKDENDELKLAVRTLEYDFERQKNKAFTLQQQQIEREKQIVNLVKNSSKMQQRVSALKGLITSKALPESYYADTLTIVKDSVIMVRDTAIIAAVDITNRWLVSQRKQLDSLTIAVSAYDAENLRLTESIRVKENFIQRITLPCGGFLQNLFCKICRENRKMEKLRLKEQYRKSKGIDD